MMPVLSRDLDNHVAFRADRKNDREENDLGPTPAGFLLVDEVPMATSSLVHISTFSHYHWIKLAHAIYQAIRP